MSESLDEGAEEEPDSVEDSVEPLNLSRMRKAELIDYAEESGIDVSEEMTKAQIIEAIGAE